VFKVQALVADVDRHLPNVTVLLLDDDPLVPWDDGIWVRERRHRHPNQRSRAPVQRKLPWICGAVADRLSRASANLRQNIWTAVSEARDLLSAYYSCRLQLQRCEAIARVT
jgi:hypothetical protein